MSTDKDFQKQLFKLTPPEVVKMLNKLKRQISLTEACVKAQQERLVELQSQLKSVRDLNLAWNTANEHTENQWEVTYIPAHDRYGGVPLMPSARLYISNMTYELKIFLDRTPKTACVRTIMGVRYLGGVCPRTFQYRTIVSEVKNFRGKNHVHKAALMVHSMQEKFQPYFSEICPPVPKEKEMFFMIDNQLIPGYRLEESK